MQALFGVLLYYILFVQRLWMAPASKGALLNIHYYYYIGKTSLEAVFKTEWTNHQCEQWARCWVMLHFFQHSTFHVNVGNIYHVILKYTPIIFFIYFDYYVATTLIYYIEYLSYWNMKKNQHSTFCVFVCCRRMQYLSCT